ncbi:MAG: hypothetical protein ACOC3X_02030 [Nanoarchaeota archaeon]
MINENSIKQSFSNVKKDIFEINQNLTNLSVSNKIEKQNFNDWILKILERQNNLEQEINSLKEKFTYLENPKKFVF